MGALTPPSRVSCWNYKIACVDRVIDGDTIDITINLGFDLSIKQRCLLYTSPSPRDGLLSRMPSSA